MNEQMQTMLKMLTEENDSLKDSIKELTSGIMELSIQITELRNENAELKRVLDNNQVAWNRQVSPDELKLRDENITLEKSVVNLCKQIDTLRDEISRRAAEEIHSLRFKELNKKGS